MKPTQVKSWLLLLGVLLSAAFLRLYKIRDYLTFLGDEGRDVLIVKHLLEGDLVGLGPTASVGGFFTGPIYYYFMAPFLWLFQLDPVGPAVMVALFGIATVFLVYIIGKEFFNEKVGIFAASLYAISPLVVAFSRSSWNPNPLPFFSILTILFVYKSFEKKTFLYLLFSGICLGIALQLHYIALFLGAAVGVYLFFVNFRHKAVLLKKYLAVFLGFLIGYSPFLAFEATHGFQNTITVTKFMLGSTGETGFAGGKFATIIGDVLFRLFGRLLVRFPPPEQINIGIDSVEVTLYGPVISVPLVLLYALVIFSIILSFILLIHKTVQSLKKKDISYKKYSLLLVWLLVGVIMFGFYKKPIYDYYFGFMFPLPFLLVGLLLTTLYSSFRAFGKILGLGLFILLFLFNLDGMPFRHSPNRQLDQVRMISEFVLEKAEGKAFNFALITKGNSDHAYRYFFEIGGNSPVAIKNESIDPQRNTVQEQLLVLCEDPECQPLGDSLWEVAGFGKAEIAEMWQISFLKLYKLVPFEIKN